MQLFTVGHSNHTFEHFSGLLHQHGVMLVVDVRSAPYSKYCPQFNKTDLAASLAKDGFLYSYAGQSLGGRPSDATCYPGQIVAPGKVDYAAVMQRDWFQAGIQRLLDMGNKQPTTLLCSEEDPAHCHRYHLITRYLLARVPEITIDHIRGDGRLTGSRLLLAAEEPAVQLSFLY